MTTQQTPTSAASAPEAQARQLYFDLLAAWNRRDAAAFAAHFTEDGSSVGFDGSPLNGRLEIQESVRAIFADHVTAVYVGKIREVRFLSADTVLVRAVCGMVPRGQSDLNPAANAIQSLVAIKQDATWRIALFHNTPAQFHGRPEMAEALTQELRQLI